MVKDEQSRKLRTAGWLCDLAAYMLILMLFTAAVIAGFSNIKVERSITIGETYKIDVPYPATLKVEKLGNTAYFNTVSGDLSVTLPEGSKEVTISRFFASPGSINYFCSFYIQFTTAEGIRQTWTWQNCATLNGLSVIPDEIYVK